MRSSDEEGEVFLDAQAHGESPRYDVPAPAREGTLGQQKPAVLGLGGDTGQTGPSSHPDVAQQPAQPVQSQADLSRPNAQTQIPQSARRRRRRRSTHAFLPEHGSRFRAKLVSKARICEHGSVFVVYRFAIQQRIRPQDAAAAATASWPKVGEIAERYSSAASKHKELRATRAGCGLNLNHWRGTRSLGILTYRCTPVAAAGHCCRPFM